LTPDCSLGHLLALEVVAPDGQNQAETDSNEDCFERPVTSGPGLNPNGITGSTEYGEHLGLSLAWSNVSRKFELPLIKNAWKEIIAEGMRVLHELIEER
jgi:hypothetical protein